MRKNINLKKYCEYLIEIYQKVNIKFDDSGIYWQLKSFLDNDKIKDLIYSNTTYELKCNILNLIGNDIRKFLNDNNIYTEVLTFENFETTITVL